MSIDYNIFTNVGSRSVNEDSVRVSKKDGAFCFVLCDGLGGHGKGELASACVADYIRNLFLESDDLDVFFESALDKAQEELLKQQKKLNAQFEMKTTATLLLIKDNMYRYAHIGDSRIYCFRNNKVLCRTLDHSVPQMLVLAGDIKEKKIRSHPDRNKLLRVMGVEWEGSRYTMSDYEELKSGDAFLLCSDGFWEPILEKQMCKTLKKSTDAQNWMDEMTKIIIKNAKDTDMDNFSGIAVINR